MIDLFLLVIVGLVTWCVASEGAWGAVLIFLSTFFAGILAMNFFEPLAVLLGENIPLGPAWQNRWDFIAFMVLFIGLAFGIRLATEQILPTFVHVHPLAHDGLRWSVGFVTGYLTMAIVLTSLHLTTLPLSYVGFNPDRQNFLGMAAPDRQWVAFVQYMTEKPFSSGKGHFFDGSTVRLANGEQQVIPTFAIRYASRRAMGGSGGSGQPEQEESAPVISTPPSGGGNVPF